ncbi:MULTISPECIES: hypothetical protein [Priestia]|uniref:hypothetical protein n=1 Tax=Priestia TaxID=2800373 RepID=UPI001C8F05CE|nr:MULTISPECIES: hypothetical protein [Priestia]MBX9986766.1 hypothetical protein [Priestia aryabhattai]MBX9999350.1 hypothetical protein [Priestia aryabhattai]MDG0059590.1 hypothetical protein [Priestia sp. P5]UYV55215.1 hypothetical protein OHU65_11755 [Priestia megaterium]
MIKFVLHIKRDGDITKSIQSKDEQMGSMRWTTCHSAVDFRVRLRFRGGSSIPLFQHESPLCLPINS